MGALAILICGTLAARHSVAVKWVSNYYWFGSFLFLRRYQPLIAFPIFFGFVTLIWQAFSRSGRAAWYTAIAAGLVFVMLIFSYFFLWTAAAVWLACFVLVWLVARFSEWPLVIKRLAPTILFAIPAFAVYALLLAHRDHTMDKVQDLTFTHAPSFYRAPQLIGALSLILLCWGVKKRRVQWRTPIVLLAASLALMPFAVFNQQIITGYSLQPDHYEMYIANYVSLLALILLWVIVWRERTIHFPRRLLRLPPAVLACLVLGWGVVEMQAVTEVHRPRNIQRDEFIPVAQRLTALAAEHGKGLNDYEVVFSPDIFVVSDNLATFAPQTPFWGTHVPFGSGLPWDKQQERYFRYLYYSGQQPGALVSKLVGYDLTAIGPLFGYMRYLAGAVDASKRPTTGEITEKIGSYRECIAHFDGARTRHPELSYTVTYSQAQIDFSNLDRWYIRDKGEKIGPFMLYQMKSRELLPQDLASIETNGKTRGWRHKGKVRSGKAGFSAIKRGQSFLEVNK